MNTTFVESFSAPPHRNFPGYLKWRSTRLEFETFST
jgi:hypothetical protein